jgi:hypothetical protein
MSKIARRKHRIYRDLDCMLALEAFLNRAVRTAPADPADRKS